MIPVLRQFPTRDVFRRPRLSLVDLLVGGALFVVLYALLRIGLTVTHPFAPGQSRAAISTNPAELPYYALRSLTRMFIALGLSVAFTLVYGTAAARSRRAEKVLIPLLDILQSVPVLGFLTVTVRVFSRLVPAFARRLGDGFDLSRSSTSQAWNMTFSFYHSLISQPRDLDEAARLMRLTKWERFWKLDVPSSMIGLVWNGMMSFGGGWFFLTASEAITVNKRSYALPGIGSYVAAASARSQLGHVFLAILVMIVMVLGVNFVFWRPMVAWSEKFRNEQTEAAEQPRSIMLDTLRRSRVPRLVGRPLRPVGVALDRATRPFGLADYPLVSNVARRRTGDALFGIVVSVVVGLGALSAFHYIGDNVGLGAFAHAFGLGAITFLRVIVVVVASTLIWVPVGVKIGMSPRLARYAQPIVQILASFPANFLFPFFAAFLIATGISLNWGGIVLMALGAQWYILFNTIAGRDLHPFGPAGSDGQLRRPRPAALAEAHPPRHLPRVHHRRHHRRGGAWNASIVAELVTYGHHVLVAKGLGSYIALSTANGQFAKTLTGIVVMSIYVVGLNRLVWRRLYRLAETRYSL